MKILTRTVESKAYTEDEAKNIIDNFKAAAHSEGYVVKSAGYAYKTKKAKGVIVAEAWVVKCVAIYNEIWGDEE